MSSNVIQLVHSGPGTGKRHDQDPVIFTAVPMPSDWAIPQYLCEVSIGPMGRERRHFRNLAAAAIYAAALCAKHSRPLEPRGYAVAYLKRELSQPRHVDSDDKGGVA